MSQIEQLQPPAAFSLEPPQAVRPVPVEQSQGKVPLKPEVLAELDSQVERLVADLVGGEVGSELFRERVSAIRTLGVAETRAAAALSGRLVERPMRALKGNDGGGTVSDGLIQLRRQVESLDPSKKGDIFSPRKLLGFIPWGNKLQDYFDEYVSAQSHIQAILDSLQRGQDELRRDNAALEEEKISLWELMRKTEQILHVCSRLDQVLSLRVEELELSDPVKARVIKEEALFEVRQKRTDLLTQMAVNLQGYMAFGMIQKNNHELIKGVERASTTTVSALRVAVAVSSALGNQRMVLDQINAVTKTTGNLIESTSVLLRDNSVDIAKQAGEAMVPIQQLQTAFQNLYSAMDSVADFRSKAVDAMQTTVSTLEEETRKAREYLDRNRDRIAGQALSDASSKATASADGVVRIL